MHDARRLLLVLLLPAFVLGFAGLGHEVGKGYYTDEGHYLHHAREVSSGELLTRSFVYPHLLYYLDGFALWVRDLVPAPVAWVARTVYGVDEEADVEWLLLRWVGAALGVLTLVPVFFLALRVAGPLAAALAGGLVVFSVHYQEGFQVNICDVPSAFFATVCMAFVGRLLETERTRDYVLAGLASGLAAAAKYPAGVVAVAVVAAWVVHRVRRRRWAWGLAWAGAASLGVFLLVHPSLFVYPDAALHGPRGIFYGLRQYGTGGWVGVLPDSNTAYYLRRLLESFGWPVALLAAVGVFGLDRAARRRLLLLAPFPAAFFVLICSMNMVVLRNLFPLIPTLAVFLGAAASGVARLAAEWTPRGRRLASASIVIAALALPAAAAVRQTASLVRPSTRELMAGWVGERLPRGAGILKESYTPDFDPYEYRTLERRFAFRIPDRSFASPRFDYLLLAGSAYWRWFRPENGDQPWRQWYRGAFATHRLVHHVEPGPWRRGPELRLYLLQGRAVQAVDRRVFAPPDAFLTHPSMAGDGEVRFTRPGRTAVFAAVFAAGSYRVQAAGRLRDGGELRVRGLEGEAVAAASVTGGVAGVELPRPGKYFLALTLPRGSRLRRLTVTGAGPSQ